MVKISIGGKLHQKNCGSVSEADELFRLCLKAKEDPSDENVKNIRAYLNEKLRIAFLTGLEADIETDAIFHEIGHLIDWYISNENQSNGVNIREDNANEIGESLRWKQSSDKLNNLNPNCYD